MGTGYTTLYPSLGPDALVGWLRWLVLLPLLGAAWNAIVGARIERSPRERRVVHGVALLAAAGAFVVASYGLLQLVLRPAGDRYLLDRMTTLFDVGHLHVELALALDPLSATWALVITGIGGLIHLYAIGYMAKEPRQARFFASLNLFLAAMLLLVLGDSLLSLFIGWEGVGLASFLLIGYWFEEEKNAAAATKAFLVNRVGDLGLVAALLALFWGLGGGFVNGRYRADGASGVRVAAVDRYDANRPLVVTVGPTLSLREITAQLTLQDREGRSPVRAALAGRRLFGLPIMMIVALGLVLAAAGKSAQWPLFVWLPDAMAGPTPVSALIHAATMVTAGVYLLCRLGGVFLAAPDAALLVAWLGLLTALIGALSACAQTDLKRILAYSTISQLGFMLLGLGVGAPEAGVFHVVTHACFKALLFLAAGAIIHAVHHAHAPVDTGFGIAHEPEPPPDPQDLRNMGGLARQLPRTGLVYLIGCWAISGVPLAAGFYSKDAILAATLGAPMGTLLFAGALFAAGLTAYYMFRSYYLVFYGRALPAALAQAAEPPRSMSMVLGILAVMCLVLGPVLGIPSLLTDRPVLLARWLAPSLAQARAAMPGHGEELTTVLLSIGVTLGGWLLARGRFRVGAVDLGPAPLREALYLDAFLRATVVPAHAALARLSARIDTGLVDGLVNLIALLGSALAGAAGFFDRVFVDGAVNALGSLCARLGARLRQLESGRLNHYLLGMTIGLLALVMAASLW